MPSLQAPSVRLLRVVFALLAGAALALGFWLGPKSHTPGEPPADASRHDDLPE